MGKPKFYWFLPFGLLCWCMFGDIVVAERIFSILATNFMSVHIKIHFPWYTYSIFVVRVFEKMSFDFFPGRVFNSYWHFKRTSNTHTSERCIFEWLTAATATKNVRQANRIFAHNGKDGNKSPRGNWRTTLGIFFFLFIILSTSRHLTHFRMTKAYEK